MNDTKSIIINTAIELFKTNSYTQVSIPMICEKAKISKGTFYYYFESKKDVLYEYVCQFLTASSEILPELLSIESPKDQLWQLSAYAFQHTFSMPPKLLLALYTSDLEDGFQKLSPTSGPTFSYQTNHYNKLSNALIEKAQRKGEIKKTVSAEDLNMLYLSSITATCIDWANKNGDFDPILRLKKFFDIIFSN